MESIDKIKRLADIVSKNTAPSSNTNTLIGNLLKAMALYMAEQHHGAVGGYQFLNSIEDLPTGDLTDKQKRTGYVVGENIYFYVGTDGDTLDGEYQNGGSFHGTKGDDGLSAYEIWKAIDPNNANKTEGEFLASLKQSGIGYDYAPTQSAATTDNTIYAIPDEEDENYWYEYYRKNGTLCFLGKHQGGLGKIIAEIGGVKNTIPRKVDKISNQETFIEDASDCDTYVDSDGNAVAKIGELGEGKKGIQASDFYDKDGNSLTDKLSAIEEGTSEANEKVDGKLPMDSSDEQVLADGGATEAWIDGKGNVGMFLDGNGILHVGGIETKDNSGKSLPTDSDDVEVVKDGSEEEVWVDAYGNIGARLTKDGKFQANLDDGTLDNEFILPKYIYCMNGVQRNVWHQAIMKRWNPYDFYLQFGGDAKYQRRTPIVATVKEGNSDGNKLTINLIDNRKMRTIQTETSFLKVANPATENDGLPRLRVSFIGSSTTQSVYFFEAFSRYVSNYELIGIRHKPLQPNVKHEGRGGTTLAIHFGEGKGVSEDPLYHFMPFWQPNDVSANETYRYWGATGFWILAHTHPNNESQSDDENGAYENGCYTQEALDKFESNTGLLISPSKGDIMYNTANSRYIVYNGSQWVVTTRDTYSWSFQYKKYLEMWNLSTPDVVSICLGTNEFKNVDVVNMEKEIANWNVLMETLIADIHTNVDSNIKIVLCNQGHFSNYGKDGIPTAVWNYKMWLHLKDLVKVFGNRESENIYVLAQGSEISAEFGFPTIMTGKNKWPKPKLYEGEPVASYPYPNWSLVFPTELYHELYDNNDYPKTVDGQVKRASVPEEKMKVLNQDVVHSTLSYPNQGVPMAAFCQYIRQH